MKTVNIHYCQANLSQILSRVQLGEEIIIANGDKAIALVGSGSYFIQATS